MPTDVSDKPEEQQEETEMQREPQTDAAQESSSQGGRFQSQEKLTRKEQRLKNEEAVPSTIEQVIRVLEEQAGLNKSFDLVFREMTLGGKRTGFFYVNGFVKDEVMTNVTIRLTFLQREQVAPNALEKFFAQYVSHLQVKKLDKMPEIIDSVLMGATALFIEKASEALVIDAKNFPTRSIEEPNLERVVRGSRDGFVETLMTNAALVRRRICDPRLKLETLRVGKRTQTNICIAYINDIVDMELVESIRDKVKKVEIDGLPLAEKQLEEAIIGEGWNPYPLVRYSERPDVVAAHLLEGHVAILVDTSPSVIILPTTFFHHVQHAEEYRQTPFIGTYLRWVRFVGIWASLFLLPLWFLLVTNPELKPPGLGFIGPEKPSHLPLLLQFLLVEIGIDLMRMAAVHTPTPLATAMGLVAAILVGEIAVKTGLFVNEVILYMAVAAVGSFATPSYELGMANRITRLALLVATAIYKIPGLVVATTAFLILLAAKRSYNSPYMWPFIPFNAKAFWNILVRRPVLSMKQRPSLTKTRDNRRQPQ